MFNIKEYNTIYKSYLNYILYNLYSLFFNIIKYKNKKKSTKQLKIYFNILSFKSISNLSYNNYYLLKNLNLYYTISIPIKINFISTIKTFNINYNIINIPKINQIGDILLNGYNRTSILYLKTTIKYINFRFNNNIYTKYLIYLSNFNYLYIYIYNFKYIYIYINKFYYINIYLTYFNIYNNYIYLNIYNIINLFNKYYNIINNNLIYNINIKEYIYKIFFNDIIYIIKKFINIKYNKIIKLDSDNIINKNIYSIYNNIFNLFKKSINLSKFIKYFKYLFNNFIIYSEKSNISIFREYFLLNPSLHYTNQLNLLAYLHNKFKLNIFGYSNKLNDKFIIPKNLRNIQYN
uniref:DNA-directed RNA polymerase subunit beta n=1 Tax=Babesia gibsoni TaxID=33632 RepID=A0A6M8NYE5_BABGI|nr:DNA-directed RNA polymerase subunit beta [Babesia gibsoni]